MILNCSATWKLQGLFSVLLEENISTMEETLHPLYLEVPYLAVLWKEPGYCFAAMSQRWVVFMGEELAI